MNSGEVFIISQTGFGSKPFSMGVYSRLDAIV